MGETKNEGAAGRGRGDVASATFPIGVEATTLVCPTGERYAAEVLAQGRIPVLSCEGPCIRGEIARQAANRLGRQPPFARACQGEAMTVPHSAMAGWVRGAERVVVVDGCFLRCQARQMRGMLGPDQLVEIDVLPFYNRWTDRFAIDDVPEAERSAVADAVAQRLVAQLRPMVAGAARP